MPTIRVLIMGAAGRDFHNFNTVFREQPKYQVVAFTATQIPEHRRPQISGRSLPGNSTRRESRSTPKSDLPS